MSFKEYKQSVLVTGSHRSGSTWLGQMLSLDDRVAYIHEPWNIGLDKIKALNPPLKNTFEYIGSNTDKNLVSEINAYLDKADNQLTKRTSGLDLSKQSLIIKDPIAFMSAEWFAQAYNSKVIILIRHPAAFVSSLKIKSWYFDFNNLVNQKQLMDDILFPYRDKIEFFAKKPQNIIDQGILLWNIFYYRTRIYEQYNPDWLYVKHEDLSRNPIAEIKSLYSKLDLPYSTAVEKKIMQAVKPDIKTEFQRDSKANIFAWQDRLSKEEIIKIKRETREISQIYYTEEDWGVNNSTSDDQTILPSSLEKRTKVVESYKHSLEVINDKKTDDKNMMSIDQQNIIMKGWALGKRDKLAKGVIVKINNQYFDCRYGSPRVDVAQFFKDKEIALCGFELALNAEKLAKGENDISVIILDDTDYTEQKFHLNLILN